MKKFNLLVVLVSITTLMISCSGNTPKSTAQKMIDEACSGNVEGFFSYVDKPAVNADFKKQFQDSLKEETDQPANEWEAWGQKMGEAIVENMFDSVLGAVWIELENQVVEGKSGNICSLKITNVNSDKNEVTVENTDGGEMFWVFKKEDENWKLVSLIGDDVFGKETPDNNHDTAKKDASQKTEAESIEEFVEEDDGDYDFRKTRWGMSQEEVKKREKGQPTLESESELNYKDIVAGMNVTVGYIFVQDQLVKAGYLFAENYINNNKYINDYEKLKNAFTQKYGAPSIDREVWNNDLYKDNPDNYGTAISMGFLTYLSLWETPNTEITLQLYGDNFDVNLGAIYSSKELEKLYEEKEQQELEEKL